MRIDINLASQPYQDSRQFWSYWGTGLVVLSLVTALLIFLAATGFVRAGHDRAQIAELKEKIAAYDREKSQAEAVLNQPQNRILREQSRFLNGLFQKKAFSWTKVFEDLERVMPAHVHVLSISPGLTADNNLELRLQVGGESHEQALDLVRKMESSNRFRQTRIEDEKVSDQQSSGNGGDRVQFEINALYMPSAEPGGNSGGMN
jgi:type IV pilus assembly protein PilN